jgi:hypothetical protein
MQPMPFSRNHSKDNEQSFDQACEEMHQEKKTEIEIKAQMREDTNYLRKRFL